MTKAPAPRPTTRIRRGRRGAAARALPACLFVLLLGGGGVVAFGQAADSAEEVIETTRTRAGELSLARRRRGEAVTIIIRLGGRLVAEKEASEEGDGYGGASVYGVYPKSAPRHALVRLTTMVTASSSLRRTRLNSPARVRTVSITSSEELAA